MSSLLSREAFVTVVRDAPLVSMDLIVEDEQGLVLVGERRNAPAQGFWFAPGGRIRKNETLQAAFVRTTLDELGVAFTLEQAEWKGVYEHFYDDNFAQEPGFGTHYVVLAYRLKVTRSQLKLPEAQHAAYRWAAPAELAVDPVVHDNTQAYFRD